MLKAVGTGLGKGILIKRINQYFISQPGHINDIILGKCLSLERMSVPDSQKDLEILYRSSNYLAVNKGFDVLVNCNEPDDPRPNVEAQLSEIYPELRDPAVVHGFRFTHRLDYATSGVLCLSLNKKAAKRLHKAFATRKVLKHYLALVRGHVSFEEMVVDQPLRKDESVEFNKRCVASTGEEAANSFPAQTRIVRLEHGTYGGSPASKILLIPYTGRTHQLRVHCLYMGHTVIGDYTYSNRSDVGPHRMMLHAYRLVFDTDHEPLDITAPDPFLPTTDPVWAPLTVYRTYAQFRCDSNVPGTKPFEKCGDLACSAGQSDSLNALHKDSEVHSPLVNDVFAVSDDAS